MKRHNSIVGKDFPDGGNHLLFPKGNVRDTILFFSSFLKSKLGWSDRTTCAQVCVAVFLLFSDSKAASPTILRGWVITLASFELDSSTTRKWTLSPDPPLAPATVNMATRDGLTLQNPGLTCTEIKWERWQNSEIKENKRLEFFCT